ncbi:MAG: hypothetical protein COW84_00865 [Gammaproteobacteria bacterium CG22_combo_CG10-13_8_21_14_all_40_8]|nr:MAG: hypothetical protein COW84_00865 [Gammaproteobacteria bacterium CG22_combo_CG10-13_8_21_14_all_40_8]
MNTEIARSNMVTRQLRPWMVHDEKILELFKTIPRENFVPEAYSHQAFSDINIPLSETRETLTPREEARLIQALSIKPTDHALEIGTGSGYITALLASLAHSVTTVETNPELLADSQKNLNPLSLDNIHYVSLNKFEDWEAKATYDVIVINGSLPELPENLKNSLAIGGRLVCILGQNELMSAQLLTKASHDQWLQQVLFETKVSSLLNTQQNQQFHF